MTERIQELTEIVKNDIDCFVVKLNELKEQHTKMENEEYLIDSQASIETKLKQQENYYDKLFETFCLHKWILQRKQRVLFSIQKLMEMVKRQTEEIEEGSWLGCLDSTPVQRWDPSLRRLQGWNRSASQEGWRE